MYSRPWRCFRHAFLGLVLGEKVPCFEKVSETLATHMMQGFFPQPVGRDPEEEWALYCRIEKALRRWPACSPTDFAEQFARAEGKVPLEEHDAWFTRAVAIIGVFAKNDRTLFLQEAPAEVLPRRPTRTERLTLMNCLGPVSHAPDGRDEGRWEDEEVGATFPRLGEVYECVLPERGGCGELARRRCTVVMRGVYWAMRRRYQERGVVPAFREVADEVGIRAGMPTFPMTFYTWAAVKNLHDRINGQMDAVYRENGRASPGEGVRPGQGA